MLSNGLSPCRFLLARAGKKSPRRGVVGLMAIWIIALPGMWVNQGITIGADPNPGPIREVPEAPGVKYSGI
jgi:hypothetical protein